MKFPAKLKLRYLKFMMTKGANENVDWIVITTKKLIGYWFIYEDDAVLFSLLLSYNVWKVA